VFQLSPNSHPDAMDRAAGIQALDVRVPPTFRESWMYV